MEPYVIEKVTRPRAGFDPEERRTEYGRLILASDVEPASLGFFTTILKVVTARHGEVLEFMFERAHRKPVQAWIRGLPQAR